MPMLPSNAVDARLLMNGTRNNIDTMQRFAEATGGKAYYHRNDLDKRRFGRRSKTRTSPIPWGSTLQTTRATGNSIRCGSA